MRSASLSLYNPEGQRKYLNARERKRFLHAIPHCFDDPMDRTFCLMLYLTGCRISEALELPANRIDESEGVVIFKTLKTRDDQDFRAVPVPIWFIDMLTNMFIERHDFVGKIWHFSRTSGYRRIVKVMYEVEIRQPRASPKGLRHGFAVACVSNGVVLPKLKRWMGHADLKTTEIYLNLTSEEDRQEMEKVWEKDEIPCWKPFVS